LTIRSTVVGLSGRLEKLEAISIERLVLAAGTKKQPSDRKILGKPRRND
jgi:hypothetical protein